LNSKKIWKFIIYPFIFAIFNYFLIGIIFKYSIGDMSINMILSDETPSFFNNIRDIYKSGSILDVETLKRDEIEFPKVNTKYGELKISSVEMKAPLIFGDNSMVLEKGVGQYSGSYVPGYGGTILVTGHNYMFPQIEKVKKDDIIEISTSYGLYKYKVREIQILDEKQYLSFKVNDDREELIYYTCYPFEALGNINTRYFIYSDYISGPKIER